MKKPIESQTPWDPTTWGFYCDACSVFFDLTANGEVRTWEEDGECYCSHWHRPCGTQARFVSYTRKDRTMLSQMREYYDQMLDRMNTPEGRRAMRDAWNALPEEIGKAAARQAMIAKLKPGEPCDHPGCLSHVSHPCEGCGRIAGKNLEK